jgi:hypothetical protein
MGLEDIDHWMTQITDVMVNTSSKLNQVADLNLALGQKLDRLAEFSAGTEQKIDRLSDKIDKLADISASTNQKLDRLVEALLRRWSLYICGEMNDEKTETVECERLSPRPFGGEGGPQPAISPAGAGRVRGSNS